MLSNKLIKVSGFIALMAISSLSFSQSKVVVIALGEEAVEEYKSVFVTEFNFLGRMGGASGADSLCQQEADLPSSLVQGRIFKAWLAGDWPVDFTAQGRTFSLHDLQYRKTDDTLVATKGADFLDGSILSPINLSADGQLPNENSGVAWSGTISDGRFGDNNCLDWTTASSSEQGGYGTTSITDSGWINESDRDCNEPANLYCFEQ